MKVRFLFLCLVFIFGCGTKTDDFHQELTSTDTASWIECENDGRIKTSYENISQLVYVADNIR